MVDEIYASRYGGKKHLSSYQIRQQKKKALQSYRHIDSIKSKADAEAQRASWEAEEYLQQFILSWNTDHDE